MTLVMTAAVALLAALVQRITGLGFALVATAPLVLVFGPDDGVRLVVLLGIVASGMMAVTMLRDVGLTRTIWLTWPALVISPLAALVIAVAPSAVLLVVVGSAAVFSLVSNRIPGLATLFVGRRGAVVAGASAGFLHVTSGLSGPPLVAYAGNERWDLKRFVATMQVVFVLYHVITLAWRGFPEATAPAELSILAAVVVAGIIGGGLLARVVPVRWARWAMFAVAWAGAIVVLGRGVLGLIGMA